MMMGTGGMMTGTGGAMLAGTGGMMMSTGGATTMATGGSKSVGTGGATMMGMGGMMMGTGGSKSVGTGGATMMGMGGMMMGTGGSKSMGTGGMTMMGMGGMQATGGRTSTTASCHTAGTLTVTNQMMSAYLIDGASNPTLTLCRGSTYTFAVNSPGHPFYIKTVQSTGTANAYATGVTGNGTAMGNVAFTVPMAAPNTLYYNCSIHAAMTGVLDIVN
jgi:hypothetical protein